MTAKTARFFNILPLVCAISTLAVMDLAPTSSMASVVVVNPTSMGNWAFDNRDAGGVLTSPTTGSMVTGPSTPPLGTGSANLVTPGGTGDQGSELRNTGYVGTALSSITALSYSTYATSWNGQQLPYLVLYLSNADRLWFEPTYSPSQGAVALNTWQTWNALTGGWYDDNGTGNPGVANVVSWSDMLAANPGATIVNSGTLGGVRFSVGFASPGETFDANIDAVTIGVSNVDTTYDFEPASATPLPAALPLFSGGLGVLGLLLRGRKRKNAKSTKIAGA